MDWIRFGINSLGISETPHEHWVPERILIDIEIHKVCLVRESSLKIPSSILIDFELIQ